MRRSGRRRDTVKQIAADPPWQALAEEAEAPEGPGSDATGSACRLAQGDEPQGVQRGEILIVGHETG